MRRRLQRPCFATRAIAYTLVPPDDLLRWAGPGMIRGLLPSPGYSQAQKARQPKKPPSERSVLELADRDTNVDTIASLY